MCDPLSVSASILTVINVAAQSCEILYKAFHLFGGAGEDLNHYLSILESLKGTFAGIAKLEKDAGSPHVIPKSLKDRVEECGLHLRDIESLVRPSYEKFQQSKTDRLWIRIKWSTAYQTQKIERLMTRIESHYKALTLELLLLNT